MGKCLYINDLNCTYGKKPIYSNKPCGLSCKEKVKLFTRCAILNKCIPADILNPVKMPACYSFVAYAIHAGFQNIPINSLKDNLLSVDFQGLNVGRIKRIVTDQTIYNLPSPCIIFSVNETACRRYAHCDTNYCDIMQCNPKRCNSTGHRTTQLFDLLSFLDWEAKDLSVFEFKSRIMTICGQTKTTPFFTHTFIHLENGIGVGCNHPIQGLPMGCLDLHRDLIYCLHSRFKYRSGNNYQRLFYVEIPD